MAMQQKSVLKGLFAGAIGGAVGTLVLNTFQTASLKGTEAVENQLPGRNTYTEQQQGLLDGFNKAHAKTAQVAASAAGKQLSPAQSKKAVPAVEFAFGIVCGAVYGAVAEFLPSVTSGFGTTYGAALFTGASEVVLPGVGLGAAAFGADAGAAPWRAFRERGVWGGHGRYTAVAAQNFVIRQPAPSEISGGL